MYPGRSDAGDRWVHGGVCIVTCPEGLKRVEDAHPDVHVYAASIDKGLNENSYIVPGLGDAGDRLYGTS